jgi:hypothetical protein
MDLVTISCSAFVNLPLDSTLLHLGVIDSIIHESIDWLALYGCCELNSQQFVDRGCNIAVLARVRYITDPRNAYPARVARLLPYFIRSGTAISILRT